jgi:hypothetical protein
MKKSAFYNPSFEFPVSLLAGTATRLSPVFLFFVTENLEIRYYAFSETSPGKSGPFGAVNALKVKGS